MTDSSEPTEGNETVREILDWAVFSLGILSLSVAVGATILSKANLLAVDADTAASDDRNKG